jgi:replicative DNA helicase
MSTTTESETALLSAMLVDPGEIDIVSADLSLADFRDSDLGCLYDAMVTLHQSGRPAGDLRVLVPELRRMGLPEAVTNVAFLGRLLMNGTAGNARFYAAEVRRGSRLRRQECIAHGLLARASAVDADPDKIAQWLDASSLSVGAETDRCRKVGDIAIDYLADLREPASRKHVVMSGILGLDETIGGFLPGELIVLAARTSVGKTALALQIASHVAERGRSVAFVSLEMRDRELVGRILCGAAGVNSQRVRSGDIDERDIGQLEWAASHIDNQHLWIWDPPRATTGQIRARAKRLAATDGLHLVIVDYIGLVQPTDPKRQRFEQVSAITSDLKAMAKELAVPVLALCQLNREADGNEPRLSHLRDSGSVEQDADCVLFLHRKTDSETTLVIAKHRHAATGSVNLRWVPARTRFDCEPTGYEDLP